MAIVNIKLKLDDGQFRASTGQDEAALGDVEKKAQRARDEFGRFVKQSDQATDSVGKFSGSAKVGLEGVTVKAAAASFAFTQIAIATGVVVSALAAPIQKFSEFETGIANVGSLGVENISGIKASILDLSANVAVPISDLAAGMYQVVSAGVAANQQIAFLEVTSKAAKAGLAESTDAINLASAVVKGYGKDWSETESILDQAFQTVKLGQTTFPELASSMGQTIPIAAALKISTRELFGAYATLTGVTGNASEVSTQLKAVLTGLARPKEELTNISKRLGFATVEEMVNSQGLSGVLQVLQKETGGSAAKMTQLFESVEATNALLALSGPQYDTLKQKTDAMTNSAGEMEKAYQINSETIAAHADILQNKLDAAQIQVIESLRPVIVGVIDLTGALVEMDWTPFIVGASASALALTAFNFPAIVAGIGTLTTAVATFGGVLTTATGGITVAIGLLAGLGVAIANSIPSETDLARERKKTAEETIKITDAELKRVRQAKETSDATNDLVEKEKRLNEQLIMQQRIISEANLLLYSKQIDEAKDSIDDLLDSAGRSGTIARRLNEDFLGNFSLMAEEAAKRSNDFTRQLNSAISGAIPATERGIELLKEQKAAYENVAQILGPAASAQKNYNLEIENRKRLLEATNAVAGAEVKPAPTISQPNKAVEFGVSLKEIHPKALSLPANAFAQVEADIVKAQEFEIRMVDLKFKTHLTKEEQYIENKRAILSDQATFMTDFYGSESQQALEANLRKIQFDEEYARKKQQIEQQAVRNTLQLGANLMANAQGQNEFLFGVGKAASIAQATVDTYAAANLALRTYPPPFGAIAAGVSIATGLINVSKITATNFERKAEGGILGDMCRQVMAANFGSDNGLFIGHSNEFVVNEKSTLANRALLELINASDGAVRVFQSRQNGGALGSTPSTRSGAAPLFDMTDVVQAIRDIRIEVRAELDSMRFFREKFPDYQREENRRSLA